MNIGKKILELRRQNNVTQDALAAELGVTAAAVSKWENGYTLPDILMLYALADFFQVTTDELLGRTYPKKQAIVVAQTEELGRKIADLVEKYNIHACKILTDYEAALAVADSEPEHKNEIQYMFTATERPLSERKMDNTNGIIHVNVQITDGAEEEILSGVELYLKNMDAFQNITDSAKSVKKS